MVSEKGANSPVYEAKPEPATGRGQIFHCNMLVPCNALPLEEPAQSIVQHRETHMDTKTNETESSDD